MYPRSQRSLAALDAELRHWRDVVAEHAQGAAVVRPEVSAWSVAQHVDHIATATLLNLRAVAKLHQDPAVGNNEPSIKAVGWAVLVSGRIPSGASAPDSVLPQPAPAATDLTDTLASCEELIATLRPHTSQLDTIKRRIPHPILGGFTPRQWLRFALIHSHHHTQITQRISLTPGNPRS
ncbi:MAG: DinB family protein [Planctomycetota bacterium]